jgi:hypothetical protein
MQYERPAIVSRERIEGLLLIKSDPKQTPSDVNLKENVVPVVWYEAPAIVARERIEGLLVLQKSEKVRSDVHAKANIVPVTW